MAVPAYLALLPVALSGSVVVAGAVATAADLLLVLLLAAGGLSAALWIRRAASGGAGIGGAAGALRRNVGVYEAVVALLAAYGLWAGASAIWSYHPDYALVKGAGYLALALGAGCIAWSGVRWGRILDAWLVGTGLTLLLTLLVVAVGPDAWVGRMVYEGGSVQGLPVPRLRGPFVHPNGLGDYLVISGVFLWARWPVWVGAGADGSTGWRPTRGGLLVGAGALALLLALVLTVSTAWLAAGVLLLLWGRRVAPRKAERGVEAGAWIRSLVLRGTGAAITAATMAGLVFPLQVGLGDLRFASSGIRTQIWSDAGSAFLAAPFVGVGAAPYLAGVSDPANPVASPALWDAHNAYLSILGQFGLAGFVLVGASVWFLVRVLRRPHGPGGSPDLAVVREEDGGSPPEPVLRTRARTAVLAALIAIGVHGIAIAGEDFRHWWAVVGVAGAVALRNRGP